MMMIAAAAGNDWICDSANGIMRPSTNPIDPVLKYRKKKQNKLNYLNHSIIFMGIFKKCLRLVHKYELSTTSKANK